MSHSGLAIADQWIKRERCLSVPDSIIREGFKELIIRLNRVGWDKARNQSSLMLEQGCLNEDCSWSCI